MRLFFALSLPEDVRRDVERQAAAAPMPAALRRTPPDALHLTLKFLGEVAPDRQAVVESAARRVAARHRPMSLRFAGGGAFPDPRRARVFWAGVDGDVAALGALAEDLETTLADAGFSREARAFSPHLTLARVRADARLPRREAETCQAALQSLATRSFDAREIHLFRSHLGSTGARYEIAATVPLA